MLELCSWSGHSQTRESMMVAAHMILITAFLVWSWKKFQPLFTLALLLKILAGISLGLLYRYYYTSGDTWTFFDDARHAANMLRENPGQCFKFFLFNDWSQVGEPLGSSGLQPLFMIKWVALLNLLTNDNYWLTSTYLSILSFVGTWMFFNSITKCYPNIKQEAVLAILFIPSIVFWSSGIIKECLALGALFVVSGFFIRWYVRNEMHWVGIFLSIFSLWILWNLKYYWMAVWLGVVIPLLMVKLISLRTVWVNKHKQLSWVILFVLSVIGISVLHPNFYYNRILNVIVENYEAYVRLSAPEDVIGYSALEPTILSIFKNAPWAVISAFFRPFVWDAKTVFQVMSGVENLILLVLFVMALVKTKRWLPNFNELHLALIVYLIVLAALLALSTPNFGSLSRYRIGFTPFLWLLLLIAAGVDERLPSFMKNFFHKS